MNITKLTESKKKELRIVLQDLDNVCKTIVMENYPKNEWYKFFITDEEIKKLVEEGKLRYI